MALPLEALEEFFGVGFDATHCESGFSEFVHFDGRVSWLVIWEKESDLLHFSAGNFLGGDSFPIVESGIYSSKLSVKELTGGGTALWLWRKEGSQDNHRPAIQITRTQRRHFSFAPNLEEGDCY